MKKIKHKDEGQVFTVTKLQYINGVVYFTAHKGPTDIQILADNYTETTKSGKVKHPFAKGIGLITISKDRIVERLRANGKWCLSKSQQQILCNHILSDYYRIIVST